MKKFIEWLKQKKKLEEATIWNNPNLTEPENKYTGHPNISGIEQYIRQRIEENPGYDPVQGMNNIAATANMFNAPDSHRGESQPLNWKMLGLLRQWGFGNQNQFYKWWSIGGKNVVAQMRDKILAQYKSQ